MVSLGFVEVVWLEKFGEVCVCVVLLEGGLVRVEEVFLVVVGGKVFVFVGCVV